MNCKFTRIIIAAIIVTATSMASSAQMRWGATVSVNMDGFSLKQKNIVTTSKSVGYGAGVIGEVIFPGIGIGLDLGLQYNMTGGKVDLGKKEIWKEYGNESLAIHNLYLPIHLRLKYTRLNGFEEILAPFVFVGPEFNIQLAHSKCDAIKFSGGDFALAFGGGLEIKKKWQISVGYHIGMTYAWKTRLLTDFSAKSHYLAVRASYFFK